jgi:hypothetical protein
MGMLGVDLGGEDFTADHGRANLQPFRTYAWNVTGQCRTSDCCLYSVPLRSLLNTLPP